MSTLEPGSRTPPPDEYLEVEQVEELRGMLREQAELILDHGRAEVRELTEPRTQDPDHLDLAVNESNREFALRLADRERRLLNKIKHALGRIEEGEYGSCESCGAPITYERLKARPVATMCIDCKTEAEQIERPRKRVF